MKTVFITGVSAGIGHALAKLYLARGFQVCGVSRRVPVDLVDHPHMRFARFDLTCFDSVASVIGDMLDSAGVGSPETLFLNAGAFGSASKRADETSIIEFQGVLNINLIAVKSRAGRVPVAT